jgi:hypothetical protein
MKISWLVAFVTFIMPLGLMAQNQNDQTIPNRKTRVVGTSSKTLKKSSLKKENAAVLTPEAQQKMEDRAKLKENQIKKHQAEKEREAIFMEYLGIPSQTHPEYAARKQKLYEESPERFEEMKAKLSPKSGKKQVISQELYDKLSPERKAHIQAHPERYQVK